MELAKVEQLMLLTLNSQLIPEISSLRDTEPEIHARTQEYKKVVTDRVDKVNAREAASAASTPGIVGA